MFKYHFINTEIRPEFIISLVKSQFKVSLVPGRGTVTPCNKTNALDFGINKMINMGLHKSFTHSNDSTHYNVG